jgi:hypothetical protein
MIGLHPTYDPNDWLGGSEFVGLFHGTTTTAPQVINGDFGDNHAVANVFWAGWKLWASLGTSNRQLAYNTNVDVLVFENDMATTTGCNTSCSRAHFKTKPTPPAWAGHTMTLVLDGNLNTPYDPQGRMMHELGHVADFVSAPNQGRGQNPGFDYLGMSGHTLESQEFLTGAMSEGFANFFAATGLYAQWATQPRICGGTDGSAGPDLQTCWGASTFWKYNLEALGGCGAGDGRREVAATGYLWDVHDSVPDGSDNLFFQLFHFCDAMATASCPSYPACYAPGQLHDSWTSIPSPLDIDLPPAVSTSSEADKNGAIWYSDVFNASTGWNTTPIALQACLSYI